MTFVDLPDGESVFVDANTFVYHFQPHPTWGAACNQFMSRIEQGRLVGCTSPQILGDVAHRLMTMAGRFLACQELWTTEAVLLPAVRSQRSVVSGLVTPCDGGTRRLGPPYACVVV